MSAKAGVGVLVLGAVLALSAAAQTVTCADSMKSTAPIPTVIDKTWTAALANLTGLALAG